MGKRRKGRKKPWQTEKRKPVIEINIIGPSKRELVERIRSVLEDELWHKEKRYEETQSSSLKWTIERYENALYALEELERRVAE